MSVIIFTEPHYPTEYDRARDGLFRMECNCRRMKWMIQNGYCYLFTHLCFGLSSSIEGLPSIKIASAELY